MQACPKALLQQLSPPKLTNACKISYLQLNSDMHASLHRWYAPHHAAIQYLIGKVHLRFVEAGLLTAAAATVVPFKMKGGHAQFSLDIYTALH